MEAILQFLETCRAWLADNWPWLAPIAIPVLVGVLNKLTLHYSNYAGLAAVLLKVSEFIGAMPSKDVPGWLKSPFVDKPPKGAVRRLPPTAALLPLALALGLSGCATSVSSHLERAHIAATAVDQIAIAEFAKKCMAEAKACGPVGEVNCPAWRACDDKRSIYKAAMNAIDAQLAVVNRLLHDLVVK